MVTSACSLMKKSAISAFALVIAGGMFVLIAQLMPLQTPVPVVFSYLGVFFVFAGLVLITTTMVAVLVPAVNRRLDACGT